MAFEKKDMTGALFRNDRREHEKQPEYKGDGLIFGQECWISAWVNETKDGRKYFAIKFEAKNKPKQEPAKPATRPSLKDEMDDFVPF